jgi:hypothetical protein
MTELELETVGEIVAERTLALKEADAVLREVKVIIGKPNHFPESESYYCPFQILGLGDQRVLWAGGFDSVQAMQIALRTIGFILERDRPSSSAWSGDDDPGFPSIDDLTT